MNETTQKRKEEATLLNLDPNVPIQEVDMFNWIVPECCKNGWASCKHCVKKQKPKKRNIGL